jgi:hypothetical protein
MCPTLHKIQMLTQNALPPLSVMEPISGWEGQIGKRQICRSSRLFVGAEVKSPKEILVIRGIVEAMDPDIG